MAKDYYPTGYGKPPVHTQFKPGCSGNPKGRPKGRRKLHDDLLSELSQMLTVTEDGKTKRITKQRAIIKCLVAKTVKGDVRAAALVLRIIPPAEAILQVDVDAAAAYERVRARMAVSEAVAMARKAIASLRTPAPGDNISWDIEKNQDSEKT